MKLTIALAQLDLPAGDLKGNLARAESAVQEAAGRGADLLLLPELWACGYDLERCTASASSLDEGLFARMRELAQAHQIALGGSLIEEHEGEYFNTFLLLDQQGKRIGAYRKIHLFQFLDEEKYLAGGNQLVLADSPWGKIGLAVCYDLRFPEVFRHYAVAGAELILLAAEWPRKRVSHWDILVQARAVENQCFLAAVNKVGSSLGAALGGRSAVVDPMGEILVQGGEEVSVLIAEIDLGKARKTRRWMPVLQDRKPEAYR